MNRDRLIKLLENVKNGDLSVDDAVGELKTLPFIDTGYARLDTHREIRTGFPEVVFCQGKRPDDVAAIAGKIIASGQVFLGSRASAEVAEAVINRFPDAVYHETAALIVYETGPREKTGLVAVVSAGTSDAPVAEEAAITAEVLGAKVERVYDAGIAGLHRILAEVSLLQEANAVVAVAGMEGALPSVVGGLTGAPVIAVPTSVGYGANLGGVAALLGMLNSCAPNVSVVNIDNGFGAGFIAAAVNRRVVSGRKTDV